MSNNHGDVEFGHLGETIVKVSAVILEEDFGKLDCRHNMRQLFSLTVNLGLKDLWEVNVHKRVEVGVALGQGEVFVL